MYCLQVKQEQPVMRDLLTISLIILSGPAGNFLRRPSNNLLTQPISLSFLPNGRLQLRPARRVLVLSRT